MCDSILEPSDARVNSKEQTFIGGFTHLSCTTSAARASFLAHHLASLSPRTSRTTMRNSLRTRRFFGIRVHGAPNRTPSDEQALAGVTRMGHRRNAGHCTGKVGLASALSGRNGALVNVQA